MIKNILYLGDASAYCDFGSEVNEHVNSRVISYFTKIKELQKQKKIDGIINLTPSYNKLIVSFDLKKLNYKEVKKIVENLDIYDYYMVVYNRWGEVMFESFDVATGWDGNYGGRGVVNDGVYGWKIQFGDLSSDKKHTISGHVTVLR